MKTLKIVLACLVIASAVFVVSCKKSNDNVPNPATDSDVSAATDNTLAENTASDIVQIGAEATDNSGSLNNFRLSSPEDILSLTTCGTIDSSQISSRIITVIFNNDTCMDGRVRSGSLTYDFHLSPDSAIHYRDPGFTFTVTSTNYVVDSVKVNVINHTVLNTTSPTFNPSTANETWSIVSNIQLIRSGGDTINWTSSYIKTLLNTSDPTIFHGVFSGSKHISWDRARVGFTGSENGSRSDGVTFSSTITDQLVRDFGSCNIHGRVPFILGTLVFRPSNKKYPRSIDYGAPNNGACDLLAAVTINGNTYLIKLP